MGGHLHALRALLGVEIFLLLVLVVLGLGLLGPLWRHLSASVKRILAYPRAELGLALKGITVLEDLGAREAVELSQKAMPLRILPWQWQWQVFLEPGAFGCGPRREIRKLLGPYSCCRLARLDDSRPFEPRFSRFPFPGEPLREAGCTSLATEPSRRCGN